MASASCEIKVGFRSSAEPGTTNSQSCAIRVGLAVAAAPVSWSGNEASRSVVDWLLRIDEPFGEVRGNKVFLTRRAWNLLREICDRLGGVQGPSMAQVVTSVTETQVQVAANTSYVDSAVAYTASVAATAEAAAEVAQSNGLSGAGSIPPPSPPPSRPNYQVE